MLNSQNYSVANDICYHQMVFETIKKKLFKYCRHLSIENSSGTLTTAKLTLELNVKSCKRKSELIENRQ